MKKFKYIVIDDEYPSQWSVLQHFKPYQNYQCVKVFYSPEEALLFLQEHEVDLIFLDIEMPEMNGFQFLEALQKNIFVVILTAYPEKYSLSAHNFFLDKELIFFTNKAQFSYYLRKIIARFEKMNSEKEMIDRINQLSKSEITTFPKKINKESVLLADILFFTVIGHNIVLRMKNEEELISRMNLGELTSFLPESIFLPINRSTIVNMLYITSFTDSTISINDHHFFLSTPKQKKVIETLKTKLSSLYKIMD
jgi:DNA-binding LytR/AlgR family response regulator